MARLSTLLLGLAALPSALTCTQSEARNFDDYIINHLPNLGSQSSSSSEYAVAKRQSGHTLKCTSSEICLYQPAYDALLCYDQDKATYQYETGLSVDIASGAYTTPDGEKGNFNEGPCPGPDFVEAEDGEGCTMVSVTAGSGDGSDSDDADLDSDSDSDSSSSEDGDGGSVASIVGVGPVAMVVVAVAMAFGV